MSSKSEGIERRRLEAESRLVRTTAKSERIERLRRQAESRLATSPTPAERQVDTKALLHELHVHQVELEFQNDQLQETQVELQDSRDRYQDLFDAAPVGYLILDPEGRVLEANRTATRLLGVEREAFIDRRLQVFASDPENVRKLNDHLARTFGAAASEEFECSLRRGDEGTIQVRLDSQSVEGPLRSARCRTALIDVTAQKRAEDALAKRGERLIASMEEGHRLESELEEARALEAIGRLAGGVAHDFNNMLAVINGTAEVALRHGSPDHALRKELERILLAGQRSAKLTHQLLSVGRRQFLSTESVDLATLVEETRSLLSATLSPNVRVIFAPPAESVLAKADPAGLQQGLVNLALNARDAMPEGGALELSLDRVELDKAGARLHPGARQGPYALLTVRDEGAGLEPETRKRIFEPFFTTKENGVGLGLASLHGYVSQSGGFIAVESALGRGTTFRIYLPAVEAAPDLLTVGHPPEPASGPEPATLSLVDDVPKSHPPEPASAPGAVTVLLVEDEPSLRGLYTQVISTAGLEVISAANGEEALRLCRERARPVEVAVLDIVMPGMNGVELANRLCWLMPECEFVLMSGYAEEDLVERIGGEVGGVLLQKPFSTELLVVEIQRALAR